MTPEETVAATAAPIHDLPSYFMLDAKTYQRGFELGFPGTDFYFMGRGGVLGRVAPDVVAAAMVFFHPSVVREAWTRGIDVMVPRDASAIFAACAHTWAARLPDDLDAARLAELTGRVVAAASPAGAPLFAGWRAMPEPDNPKALALHRLFVLRELRGAIHAVSVMAEGIRFGPAVQIDNPDLVEFYGWSPNGVDPESVREPLEAARERTDRLFAPTFTVLDGDERQALAELANAALDSVQ